jgi:hypothetical protein
MTAKRMRESRQNNHLGICIADENGAESVKIQYTSGNAMQQCPFLAQLRER